MTDARTIPRRRSDHRWPWVSLAICLHSASAHATTTLPSDAPSSVYGGEPSAACDWPTTVFLGNCTGTLIHPEVVMYASHCGDAFTELWFGEDFSTAEGYDAGFSVATEFCMVNPEAAQAVDGDHFRAADFAFCKLAEPVLDVPIVPPLVGCEKTILVPGAAVTLAGFGLDELGVFGVKRAVTTFLDYIDDFGVAVIGGNGQSSCNGDSGGPGFVQLPDGSWRVFAIVSGPNAGGCGDPSWYPTSFLAVPFIEAQTGIDVTPCHYASGGWNPSPACRDFPLTPDDGAGKSWAEGCAGGPTTSWSSVCGAAFDSTEDLVAPMVSIDEPADRVRFDTYVDEPNYALTVRASAADQTSGVQHVALAIDGEVIDEGLRRDPPWEWDIALPPGVWELEVVATDWAGNAASSAAVVIGVDEDPPAAPEPSTSSGSSADSSSSDGASQPSTGIGESTSSGGGDTSEGGAPQVEVDTGCSCRSAGDRAAWLWGIALLFGAGRRRRSLQSRRRPLHGREPIGWRLAVIARVRLICWADVAWLDLRCARLLGRARSDDGRRRAGVWHGRGVQCDDGQRRHAVDRRHAHLRSRRREPE
jgi:MYXO-CTERM domain-containing protein